MSAAMRKALRRTRRTSGRSRRKNEAAVQGHAVHHRGHAELAHAVIDVVARGFGVADALRAFPDGQVGTGQIRGTARNSGSTGP